MKQDCLKLKIPFKCAIDEDAHVLHMHTHTNWNILDVTFTLYDPNFIGIQSSITDNRQLIEYFKLNKYRYLLIHDITDK